MPKILWICNKAPALVAWLANEENNPYGGWLDTVAEDLLNRGDVTLGICCLSKEYSHGKNGNLTYWCFTDGVREDWFSNVIRGFAPDSVHIWGTEFPHSVRVMRACAKLGLARRTVISIQGLVSVIGRYHYVEGLPNKVIERPSIGDLARRTSISTQRDVFLNRGYNEVECIKLASHVIGRTEWDRACVAQINPKAMYHFCNETLRPAFYQGHWSVEQAERHSIFVSQCSYPIKGFHFAVQALALLKELYPDARLFTTGKSVFKDGVLRTLWRDSYQTYLAHLIDECGLRDSVVFLGTLAEEEMRDQYLKSHVFVSPSTIENSPNSVGEAMLLGCPVVSSYVGGVMDMIEHEKEGFLYQASAPYMLAWYIKKIFEDDDLATSLSSAARKRASMTHDREKNMNNLMGIYEMLTDGRVSLGTDNSHDK